MPPKSRAGRASQASTSASRSGRSQRAPVAASQVIDLDLDDDDDEHHRDQDVASNNAPDLDQLVDSQSHRSRNRPAASSMSTASSTPVPESQANSRSAANPVGSSSQRDNPVAGPSGTQAGGSQNQDYGALTPTPSGPDGDEDDPDCIRILVATDNHIGYNERDPVRGRDSIETFREILQLAVRHEVDMLLLAGDLFHENKPSRASLHQTIALLREYCMGSRPISIEIVSDAGIGLQTGFNFPPINYEDVNYNIGLPVFSIHGNHDDPQGTGPEGALCALDILSASGLVNYFGRQDLAGNSTTDEEALAAGIQVKPLLLQKGATKLAMYGIGNLRDERFVNEMRKNRVSMFRPAEDPDSWFNLLLIHQNRATRGQKNNVNEDGFGDEVDLIIWGHEHDCRIDPEPVAGKRYYVSQPGSSVATSLSPGEAIPKHVGLLKVKGKAFDMEKIRLRTVRPFVTEDVNLGDVGDLEGENLANKMAVNNYLKGRVNALLQRADEEWAELYEGETDPPPPMLPLVRIRVEYTGFEVGNPQRFGQDFAKRVANPKDIVQYFRRKVINRNGKKVEIDQPDGVGGIAGQYNGEVPERIEKIKVETLVRQYLEAQTLQMLHENGIGYAVNAYVEKDDKHAIEQFIAKTLDAQRKEIERGNPDAEADSDEEIERGMVNVKDKLAREFSEKSAKRKGKQKAAQANDTNEEDDGDGAGAETAIAKAGGRGRERASPDSEIDQMSIDGDFAGTGGPSRGKAGKGKSTAASKGSKKTLFAEPSDSDDDAESDRPASKSGARGTTTSKGRAAASTSATARKKAAPKVQSQLSFSAFPSKSSATSSRTAAKTAAAKNKQVVEPDSEEEQGDMPMDDDSDDEPPKRRPAKKR